MKLIHIVETIDDKISSILSFQINENTSEKEVEETVNNHFITIINEFIFPAVLSEESRTHWLKNKVYHHGKNYRLEIVSSHIN